MARLPRLARRQPSGDSRPEKVPTTMVLKRRKDPCLRCLGKITAAGRGIIVSKVFDRCLPSMQEFE